MSWLITQAEAYLRLADMQIKEAGRKVAYPSDEDHKTIDTYIKLVYAYIELDRREAEKERERVRK